MPHTSIDLNDHQMVALSRAALASLRGALLNDAVISGASYLQEAGYAGSESLFQSFRKWAKDQTDVDPGELGLEEFGDLASRYFRDAGWGSFTLGSIGSAVATVDSEDWGEADSTSDLHQPACFLTTGMLAGFFGQLAESPLAVLEVECRSMGAPRCRFLLGASEVVGHIYEGIERGMEYEAAVQAA
ncbi:MAG: hypothetical protein H7Z74_00485 [Anaerolineae bacterium]|nr:hypothetical protein [Gemmatimonadaceae bacterium]